MSNLPPWLKNKKGGTMANNQPVGSAGQPNNGNGNASGSKGAIQRRRAKLQEQKGKK